MAKFERPILEPQHIEAALELVRLAFSRALEKHGNHAELSWHEVSGDVTEEYHEFLDEIQANSDKREAELVDIAIAALWGIASKRAGYLE